jgi:hypothetical protein
MVSLFGKINVQPFRQFSVETIRSAEKANGIDVMNHRVNFWNIEVFAYPKVDENVLAGMK